jgi:hypothetical protein
MPCVVCGNPKTCRAHIQPAALGKDIIKHAIVDTGRKTLSLAAPDRMDNSIQSGLFDDNILCSGCDGKLGLFDDHAIEVSCLLGTTHEVIDRRANRFTVTRVNGIDHERLALFGAAVVWRTSVSNYRELSEFTLGNNEAWFRDMLFRGGMEIPTVLVARLVGANALTHGAAATMLSYPQRIKIRGKSVARFYIRGLMFLVQTTRAADTSLRKDSVTIFGKTAGPTSLTGSLMPFEKLGELAQVEKSKYVQHVLTRRDQRTG